MKFHSIMEHKTDATKLLTPQDCHVTLIRRFQRLSQYHMEFAMDLNDRNQALTSLILCDWALTTMMKALYLKKNHKPFPKSSFSVEELLHLLHSETSPALEVVVFIGTIQYMASPAQVEQVSKMKNKNIIRLIRRTDEILYLLSTKIDDDSSKDYQSIF